MPGVRGNKCQYFEFALWVADIGRVPTIVEIEAFFGVSWISAWRIQCDLIVAIDKRRAQKGQTRLVTIKRKSSAASRSALPPSPPGEQ